MVKIKIPLPPTPDAWLEEIARAYVDAHETIPFGPLVDVEITPNDLLHLAPRICLKFRGIGQNEKILKRATDAALSSYVATENRLPELFAVSQLAFAFCYLASHFGLDLMDGAAISALMDYTESHQAKLVKRTETLIGEGGG